jgi:hypothetical protein
MIAVESVVLMMAAQRVVVVLILPAVMLMMVVQETVLIKELKVLMQQHKWSPLLKEVVTVLPLQVKRLRLRRVTHSRLCRLVSFVASSALQWF